MSALADRKPTTIDIYEVRYWNGPDRTDSSVTFYEDQAAAQGHSDRANYGPTSTGSFYYVSEHVLHLRAAT